MTDRDTNLIKGIIRFESVDESINDPNGVLFTANKQDHRTKTKSDWPNYFLYGVIGHVVLGFLGGLGATKK